MSSKKFYISLSNTEGHTHNTNMPFSPGLGVGWTCFTYHPQIMCSNQEWLNSSCPRGKRSEATPSVPVADHNFCSVSRRILACQGIAAGASEDSDQSWRRIDRRRVICYVP